MVDPAGTNREVSTPTPTPLWAVPFKSTFTISANGDKTTVAVPQLNLSSRSRAALPEHRGRRFFVVCSRCPLIRLASIATKCLAPMNGEQIRARGRSCWSWAMLARIAAAWRWRSISTRQALGSREDVLYCVARKMCPRASRRRTPSVRLLEPVDNLPVAGSDSPQVVPRTRPTRRGDATWTPYWDPGPLFRCSGWPSRNRPHLPPCCPPWCLT